MKSRIENGVSEEDVQKEYDSSVDEIVTAEINGGVEDEVHDLLAGYVDENGVTHKTFTIREMTGKDEEAIQKSDIKSNGAKVISTLLTRCTLSIGEISKKDVSPKEWENIIKSLYVGDQDIILLAIRKSSIGDTIEANHICPNPECKAKLHTEVDIDELAIEPFKGTREIPFELIRGYKDKKGEVHKIGFMRLPNGFDREILTPLARKNLAKAETIMLTRICKFKDGAYVDENVMSNLTTKDRNYLIDLMHENNFGIDMTSDITCDVCGEEFKANLNVTNFI